MTRSTDGEKSRKQAATRVHTANKQLWRWQKGALKRRGHIAIRASSPSPLNIAKTGVVKANEPYYGKIECKKQHPAPRQAKAGKKDAVMRFMRAKNKDNATVKAEWKNVSCETMESRPCSWQKNIFLKKTELKTQKNDAFNEKRGEKMRNFSCDCAVDVAKMILEAICGERNRD